MLSIIREGQAGAVTQLLNIANPGFHLSVVQASQMRIFVKWRPIPQSTSVFNPYGRKHTSSDLTTKETPCLQAEDTRP